MLPQYHVKDPGRSAKSAGGRLHLNNWSQSTQLDEPLWTDPGLKSGISVHELISTKK